MRYSPEEIFKKFINSVLSDASLDFFVKRAAVFLSMMMPVSSLFIFRSVEGSITKLAECNKTPAINISDHFAISPESMTRLRTEKHFFSEGACNLKIFTAERNERYDGCAIDGCGQLYARTSRYLFLPPACLYR